MHVLIVDDHPLYIKGVQALLFELDSSIESSGAHDLAEAFDKARGSKIDLVLMDLTMPGISGLEGLKRMRQELPETPVVVISGDEHPQMIWSAIDLGAAGYIPKDTNPALTVQALRLVLAHGVYIPPQALKYQQATGPAEQPQLSERQLVVLQGLLQGKSNKTIARDLGIAENTVKVHVHGILQVLGVSSRLQIMMKAHELRLVEFLPRM
jgi:DNA-binding NarL/FixJ family response regulator